MAGVAPDSLGDIVGLAAAALKAAADHVEQVGVVELALPEQEVLFVEGRLRLAVRALSQASVAVVWLLKNALRGRTDKATLAHGVIEIAGATGTVAACAGVHYEIYRRT